MLICISLMIPEAEHLFHASVACVCVFFRRVPRHHLCPLKKKPDGWVFLSVELYEFFIYFEYNPLMRFMICRYFLPFFRLSLFIL